MSPGNIDEDTQNLGYLLFNQHDTDHNSRAENTPTPAANLRHTQPEHAIEIPKLISYVQSHLNTILPHLVDTVYHRVQAANQIQSPPTQSARREVQLDDKIPDNIRVPTETDMREVINYAVSKAIPALIMAVDERVGSILGKSVSTMKVTTNRVKVATQKRVHNPRRFTNKQSSPLDQDNGDTAAPTKSNGPKSTKINKQRVCFRHLVGAEVSEPQSEASCSNRRFSLSSLPTELITMIAESLCDGDLYNLTRVSRYMAAIGCPKYLRSKGITLSPSRFSLTVCNEGFKVLPIWHRSPDFTPLPLLFCEFDLADVSRVVLQMQELRTSVKLFSSGSRPIFDHILLNNFQTAKLQDSLELLQTVHETGCHAITMTGLGFEDAGTVGMKEADNGILLGGLQELTFEYCPLSPSQWMNFLSKLHIPSLHQLTIAGETSMVAVYRFLSQHPNIRVLRLQCTANDVPSSLGRLKLPLLRSLDGSSSQILHVLQSLPSMPSLDELVIQSDSPTSSHHSLLDEVTRCLTMSKGSLALEIRLLTKEASMTEMTRANVCALTAEALTLPCTVRSLYIEFEDVCDEFVLAYCETVMTLLSLHHIKLAKAELHRGAGGLVWGKCTKKNNLCKLVWRTTIYAPGVGSR